MTLARTDRIQLTYNVTFTTPFHCGTGLSAGLIDRTVVRDNNGYLYVPGSTFKGGLREHCERLSNLYLPHPTSQGHESESGEKEPDGDVLARSYSPHDETQALRALGNTISMVTRVFGLHNHPGLLFFDDLRQGEVSKDRFRSDEERKHRFNPEDERELPFDRGSSKERGTGRYKGLQTGLYTQARIHRPTRTAARGALYTSEFGIKNLTLEGSIKGWLQCTPIEGVGDAGQEPTYSLLLLLAGIKLMDGLGSNKSTGKGQCHCEITTLKVNGEDRSSDWSSWLDHLDKLADYILYAAQQEEDI